VLRETRRSSKPEYRARYPDARSAFAGGYGGQASLRQGYGLASHFRDANTGAGQGFTDLAAVVQLRLRVASGLQTFTVKSRLLTGENAVQFRGNPPNSVNEFTN
jgi:hypothetical protein